MDLLDMNGNVLYGLCVKFDYFRHPKQYNNLTNAILKPFLLLTKGVRLQYMLSAEK